MELILVTVETSQLLMSWLNVVDALNIAVIFVTLEVTGRLVGTVVKLTVYANANVKSVSPISPKLVQAVKYCFPVPPKS